ncbi:MAG: 1,4-alpha-glucan branching enzyme, partial [Candidatus Accumulibacter sp.]|nr:1,4-alpha-glucan branching enzyme [Accumulibacter sp.]
MLDSAEIIALCRAEHGDPYAVLGMHTDADGKLWVRSLQPGALAVAVLEAKTGRLVAELEAREIEDVEGFFEGVMPRRRSNFPYRLRITWASGVQETDDPYRFWTVLGEMDVWLLAEGSHLRPFERLGAHLCEIDGVAGTAFAVWAPDAQRVSVVGDFNTWDGRRHQMRLRRECGVWEIFLPGVSAGAHYKYEIRARDGNLLPLKADPYGFQSEMRPSTASIVCALPPPVEPSASPAGDQLDAPLSVYGVHLASWRRADDGGFPDWQRISET